MLSKRVSISRSDFRSFHQCRSDRNLCACERSTDLDAIGFVGPAVDGPDAVTTLVSGWTCSSTLYSDEGVDASWPTTQSRAETSIQAVTGRG